MADIELAMVFVKDLINLSVMSGKPLGRTIVFVGDSAKTYHGIHQNTNSVDFFVNDFDRDIVYKLEQACKEQHSLFRLNVSPTETLGGDLVLKDIETASLPVANHEVGGKGCSIRALSIDDLVLSQLAIFDTDIDQLLLRTTEPSLMARFNETLKWYGNRDGLLRYGENFVACIERHFGLSGQEVIKKTTLAEHIKEMLIESRLGGDHDYCS